MDHIKASIDARNERIAQQFKDVAQYVEYEVYALIEALKEQRGKMIEAGQKTLASFQNVVDAIQDRRNNMPLYVEAARLDVDELKACDDAVRALSDLRNAGLKTIKLSVGGSRSVAGRRSVYDQIKEIREGRGYAFELPADVKAKLSLTVAQLRMAPKQA